MRRAGLIAIGSALVLGACLGKLADECGPDKPCAVGRCEKHGNYICVSEQGGGGGGGGNGGTGGESGMGGTGGTGGSCTCDPGFSCPDCTPDYTISIKALDDAQGPIFDVEIDVTATGSGTIPDNVALAATFDGAALDVPAPAGSNGVLKSHLDLSQATTKGDAVELKLTASLADYPKITPANLAVHVDNLAPRLTAPRFDGQVPRNLKITGEVGIEDAHATGANVTAQLTGAGQDPGDGWLPPSSSTATTADFALDQRGEPIFSFQGSLDMHFTASDSFGNTSSGKVTVGITRLAWKAAIGDPVKMPIAMLPTGEFVVAPDRAMDNVVLVDATGAITKKFAVGSAAVPYAPAVGTRGIYVPVGSTMNVINPGTGNNDSCDVANPIQSTGAIGSGDKEFAIVTFDDDALHSVGKGNGGVCAVNGTKTLGASGSVPTLATSGGVLRAFVGGTGTATVSINDVDPSGAFTPPTTTVPAAERNTLRMALALDQTQLFFAIGALAKSFDYPGYTGAPTVRSQALSDLITAPPAVGAVAAIYPTAVGLSAVATAGAWNNQLSLNDIGEVDTTPALGADGFIYAISHDGTVHVDVITGATFDTAEMHEVWKSSVAGTVVSSPVLSCDGLLVFGSDDGNVYAIATDSKGLDPASPWPRYQHDNLSSGNGTNSNACP